MLFQFNKLHSTAQDVKTVKNGEEGRFGSSHGPFEGMKN